MDGSPGKRCLGAAGESGVPAGNRYVEPRFVPAGGWHDSPVLWRARTKEEAFPLRRRLHKRDKGEGGL